MLSSQEIIVSSVEENQKEKFTKEYFEQLASTKHSFDDVQKLVHGFAETVVNYLSENQKRMIAEAKLKNNNELACFIHYTKSVDRIFYNMAKIFELSADNNIIENIIEIKDEVCFQQLEKVFESSTLLNRFDVVFETFEPKFNKEGIKKYRSEFLDYFFAPIETTDAWKVFFKQAAEFLNVEELTRFRNLIASAFVFKIQSKWSKNNFDKQIAYQNKIIVLTTLNNSFTEGENTITEFVDKKFINIIEKELGNEKDWEQKKEGGNFVKKIITYKKFDIEKELSLILQTFYQNPYFNLGVSGDHILVPRLLLLIDKIEAGQVCGEVTVRGSKQTNPQMQENEKQKAKESVAKVILRYCYKQYHNQQTLPDFINRAYIVSSQVLGGDGFKDLKGEIDKKIQKEEEKKMKIEAKQKLENQKSSKEENKKEQKKFKKLVLKKDKEKDNDQTKETNISDTNSSFSRFKISLLGMFNQQNTSKPTVTPHKQTTVTPQKPTTVVPQRPINSHGLKLAPVRTSSTIRLNRLTNLSMYSNQFSASDSSLQISKVTDTKIKKSPTSP